MGNKQIFSVFSKIESSINAYVDLLRGFREGAEVSELVSLRNEVEGHEGSVLALLERFRELLFRSPRIGVISDSFDFLKEVESRGLSKPGLPFWVESDSSLSGDAVEFLAIDEDNRVELLSIDGFKKGLGIPERDVAKRSQAPSSVGKKFVVRTRLSELREIDCDKINLLLFPSHLRDTNLKRELKESCDFFVLILKEEPQVDFSFLAIDSRDFCVFLYGDEIAEFRLDWVPEDRLFVVSAEEDLSERFQLIVRDFCSTFRDRNARLGAEIFVSLGKELQAFKLFIQDYADRFEEEKKILEDRLEGAVEFILDWGRRRALDVSCKISGGIGIDPSDSPDSAVKKANRSARELVEEFSDDLNRDFSQVFDKAIRSLYEGNLRETGGLVAPFMKSAFALKDRFERFSLEHEHVSIGAEKLITGFEGFLSFLLSSLPSITNIVLYAIMFSSVWLLFWVYGLEISVPLLGPFLGWIKGILIRALFVILFLSIVIFALSNWALWMKQTSIVKNELMSAFINKWRQSNSPYFFMEQIEGVLSNNVGILRSYHDILINKLSKVLARVRDFKGALFGISEDLVGLMKEVEWECIREED